jgi:predicted DNA-binding protein
MTFKAQLSTTEMQVTSIRFERELIDQLKALSGSQGYQSLVREVLWDYVRQHAEDSSSRIKRQQIRTVMAAEARRQERCAITGNVIKPHEAMWMAFTTDNQLVPLSIDSLA